MNLIIFFLGITVIVITLFLISHNGNLNSSIRNEDEILNTENTSDHLLNHSDESFNEIFMDEFEALSKINKSEENKDVSINYYSPVAQSYYNNNFFRDNEKNNLKRIEASDSHDLVFNINRLRAEGLSSQEIAKELGKGIREVDTIIRINKLKNS